MKRRHASSLILLVLLLAEPLLLCGCDSAVLKRAAIGHTSSNHRTGEPGHPNSGWIGSDVKDLIESRGEPANVINATLLGGKPSAAYVYPSSQDDGCIDAFVVSMQSGKIIDYFCR